MPINLATSQAAFGQTPNRWYSEPQAGAVSLYSTYTMSFQACYDSMTAATYTTAPTAATAASECASMQRKYWQRTPTADEIKAIVDGKARFKKESKLRQKQRKLDDKARAKEASPRPRTFVLDFKGEPPRKLARVDGKAVRAGGGAEDRDAHWKVGRLAWPWCRDCSERG